MSGEKTPAAAAPAAANEETVLRARLAAARAARAAFAEQEAPRIELALLAAQVAEEEQAAEDEAAVARLEREHGDTINRQTLLGRKLAVVRAPAGNHGPSRLFVLKAPDVVKFKQFSELEKSGVEDVEKITFPCIVYPDKTIRDRVIDELPGHLYTCADAVAHLAGVRKSKIAGK
jgi:hypothetical protein